MKRSPLNVQTFFMILLFSAFFASCSNRQHEAIFDSVRSLLAEQFPGVPVRTAWAMYP